MIGDVPTSVHVMDLRPKTSQTRLVDEQIGAITIASDRVHVRVLQQEEVVVAAPSFDPAFVKRTLQIPRFGVGQPTGIDIPAFIQKIRSGNLRGSAHAFFKNDGLSSNPQLRGGGREPDSSFDQTQLGFTRILAPLSGTLLRRDVEPGETAFPGSALMTLADLSVMKVKVYVPGPMLGRIRIDQPVAAVTRVGVDRAVEGCVVLDRGVALGGDALTDRAIEVGIQPDAATGLPNTFVPGRNLIFLTYAAAYAYQRDIGHLVAGVAQTDYSGYPDCREETIEALQQALRLGMESDVQIHTPLMHRSKRETVELARDLGALDAMALTHTCYNGERPPCRHCPACELRAKGFAEAGIEDPLLEGT